MKSPSEMSVIELQARDTVYGNWLDTIDFDQTYPETVVMILCDRRSIRAELQKRRDAV
jgi:hypothetical protein